MKVGFIIMNLKKIDRVMEWHHFNSLTEKKSKAVQSTRVDARPTLWGNGEHTENSVSISLLFYKEIFTLAEWVGKMQRNWDCWKMYTLIHQYLHKTVVH